MQIQTEPSALSEFVLYSILGVSEPGLLGRFREALLTRTRFMLSRKRNRFVRYKLDGCELLLPLSHDLPIYRKAFPEYSSNVGRLSAHILCKYPRLKIIDIGANVGDTVAIIRAKCEAPILCIEGDDFYFHLLQHNLVRAKLSNVQACQAFVAWSRTEMHGWLRAEAGSASFVQDKSEVIHAIRLTEILDKYQDFREPKLLKIDIDGFDCQILAAETAWLDEVRPLIMIEYDPYHTGNQGYDAERVFDNMRSIGYQTAIFWDNNGDYLLSANLANLSLLHDLHSYYSGRGGGKYADVALIHGDDLDLAGQIRDSEIAYFNSARPIPT